MNIVVLLGTKCQKYGREFVKSILSIGKLVWACLESMEASGGVLVL